MLQRLTPSLLLHSAASEKILYDSSFFQRQGHDAALPTPDRIRNLSGKPGSRPDPVKFHDLGLLVKFGPNVTVEEGMCLWGLRKLLHPGVPVPEVYGWRIDGGDTFIYIELIQGITLSQRWPRLDNDAKKAFSDQLRKMVDSFRGLKQDAADIYIGKSDFHFATYQCMTKSHGTRRLSESRFTTRLCIRTQAIRWSI